MFCFTDACQYACTCNKIQKLGELLKQLQKHKRKWRKKTNIEQKLKEIKGKKDLKNEDVTSRKISGLNDLSLPYHIPIEPWLLPPFE